MKEINYKEMKFNPFNLIGDEWMLVAPGPTQTGWIDDDFAKEVIPIIPMGKLIQPQDIAETILFLASEQARMLTGQVIKVSGGHAL